MTRRPNLLYVFADAFRLQALGCRGEDPVRTPNLDAFATDSVRLSHCVSCQPICSPYRGMLMTGQYPHRSGVPHNCNSNRPHCYLRPETVCLSDVLADQGYHAGYIGKWHLDTPGDQSAEWLSNRQWRAVQWDAFTPPGPQRHGFDFWYSYGAYNDHLHPHYWTGDGGIESRIDVDQWAVEHETDVAIRFLRNEDAGVRDPDKPFALVVSYNPPHQPFHLVPERYREIYRNVPTDQLLNRPNVQLTGKGAEAVEAAPDYFAMCTGVDDQFGRLLAELDALGLADDTIVVFTSDHGEMLGSHGRMHKVVPYDESMLVPFMMRGPGIEARDDDLLLTPPDLFPTLLGLLGVDAANLPEAVQGADRSEVLRSGQGERPDDALYLNGGERIESTSRGLRTHRYRYAGQRGPGGPRRLHRQLFDSETDPYQMHNVADDHPALVNQFHERLLVRLREIDDPWVAARERAGVAASR